REAGGAGGGDVDNAVTVVVLAVADLGGRADGALAPQHAAHAALAAGLARPDAGQRRIESLDAAVALAGDAVVDDAVAVVVEAVADLRRRDADLAAAARDVVDDAVAVVVEAVADLGAGPDRAHAGAERVGGGGRAQARAGLDAHPADADARARRRV